LDYEALRHGITQSYQCLAHLEELVSLRKIRLVVWGEIYFALLGETINASLASYALRSRGP
jgi:hypothetical protein